MTVRLHRCGNQWLKLGGHPCWKVEKALQEVGVAYEVVPGPLSRRKRTAVKAGTGQDKYPAIEFENGSWYRAESKEMAQTIRAGRLAEQAGGGTTSQPSG